MLSFSVDGHAVSVPDDGASLPGDVDSLNLSAAAAVLCFEPRPSRSC